MDFEIVSRRDLRENSRIVDEIITTWQEMILRKKMLGKILLNSNSSDNFWIRILITVLRIEDSKYRSSDMSAIKPEIRPIRSRFKYNLFFSFDTLVDIYLCTDNSWHEYMSIRKVKWIIITRLYFISNIIIKILCSPVGW